MRPLALLRDLWRHRRGKVNRPRFLTHIVTFRCNARCVMCDSWKKDSPEELGVEEIAGIYGQLPRLDAVRLTGGEPFVRPDLPEIARLAQETLRPSVLMVSTNGFLTRRIVEFCQRRSREVPLRLMVSLDGVGERHNEIRGRQEAWDMTFATLGALAPRQRELRLRLSVNQTIVDQDGLGEYAKLKNLLHPLGVTVNAVIAYHTSATYSLTPEVNVAPQTVGEFATPLRTDLPRLRRFFDEVERDLRSRLLFERLAKGYYWRGMRNRLLGWRGVPHPPCVALNAHLRLYPNGDVPVCQYNSHRVGNLRRSCFDEVWLGNPAQQARAWVRRCPGCWAECEIVPSAIYSGDLLLSHLTGAGPSAPTALGQAARPSSVPESWPKPETIR